MTVIVAVRDKKNKKIVLGTDSLGTSGGGLKVNIGSKILKLDVPICDGYGEIIETKPLYIAISGYGYIKQYLLNAFEVPLLDSQQDFLDYLYNSFLTVLREELMTNSLVELDNSKLSTELGMIFVFDGEMYEVTSSFAVDVINEDYMVNGSGWAVATGSIYTNLTYHADISIVDVVKQAIETCGNTTVWCDDKVNIEVISY